MLLIIPLIGVLIPTFHNRLDPELAGIPFFYWYQMLWIPLSVAITRSGGATAARHTPDERAAPASR